jgi:hypothetical protein
MALEFKHILERDNLIKITKLDLHFLLHLDVILASCLRGPNDVAMASLCS